ncbi:I78 family peptidase inhibitor [Streptomyces sp. CC208A]|uniref:I78 family peptidase inhibitor n=1 Tax=Streptomyces sp. CC208A TaxID=3044573 RepID=UPI0024A8F206|nr:I78 family peptidase inhibitor [Streptomyces sp. CC208A]
MASHPRIPEPPRDTPESYVGLDADGAARLARTRGWHVVRALPPGAIVTMEYVTGRINFEVEDDTVTRCWIG